MWQVQNRFVEDAAKSHGVGAQAQMFVREEAISWVLERHGQNPINHDCMSRCGFGTPLQTLVSASYEVTSGLGRGGRASQALGSGSYDTVALRLLILHSFVETCWRVWQDMIHQEALKDEADAATNNRSLKYHYDNGWKKHATWGFGSIKTENVSRTVLPWSAPENPRQPPPLALGQYVSPLAKRVRPGWSRSDIGRPVSGRPISGQRPFSATTALPSPEYTRLFPPNQRHRLETNALAQGTRQAEAVVGYEALGYIRDELSRSVFANVAEAFAWFDLDRRQLVSISELDVGLKNLSILGVDVASIFALCRDVQLKYGTREPEIGEFQFARLFQWNDQLVSSGKGLLLYNEHYREASDRAKQNQKRIIEKVKAHIQLRPDGEKYADSQFRNTADPLKRAHELRSPQNESAKTSMCSVENAKQASPKCKESVSKPCTFCKRSHEHDFCTSETASLSSPPLNTKMESTDDRPSTHSPIPSHKHKFVIRHSHLPSGKFGGSTLSSRQGDSARSAGSTKTSNMRSSVPVEQLAAGWDYDTLERHLDVGYEQFAPHAIIGIMVTAVLDQDLCRRIMWSQGRQTSVPRQCMPGHRAVGDLCSTMPLSPTSQTRNLFHEGTVAGLGEVERHQQDGGGGVRSKVSAARPPRSRIAVMRL